MNCRTFPRSLEPGDGRQIRANVDVDRVAAFVVLAVAGVATLWMAVLADTGACALVVANAVRLRRFR